MRSSRCCSTCRRARGTYHLVAGDRALTVSALSELAADAFGLDAVEFDPPGDSGGDVAPALVGYFDVRCRFDARRSRAALDPLGVGPGACSEEFAALVAYAERSAWGKRPLVREQAPPLAV